MPYFSYSAVRASGVIPGVLFTGDFQPIPSRQAPHLEDCSCENLRLQGIASKNQFRDVLRKDLSESVSKGFSYNFRENEKVIPIGQNVSRSIITVSVDPKSVHIHPDGFNEKKIKISFIDASGVAFRYLPITDLGFYDYASKHRDEGALAAFNRHLHDSKEVLLRVGLSRVYAQGDRHGFWIQINGIYTFPSRLEIVRGYGE